MQRRLKKLETKKKFALGSKYRELNEQDKYDKRQANQTNNTNEVKDNVDEPDAVYEKLTQQTVEDQAPRRKKL